MKIPSIKKLVEAHTLEELKLAEDAIYEEKHLPFDVEGSDEGEQLTHILAAAFIINEMKEKGLEFTPALRRYTERVRNSIN